MKLDGKVAVVTGGSSGIGLASAKALIAEGAHVYITGRRPDELKAALTLGEHATPIQGDVSDPADVDALYEQVQAGHGRLDIVFANAGFAAFAPLGELTEEHIDVNGFFDYAASITPLSRTGRDTEIAKVVAFLAPDDSSFVTGSEIFVDGGIAQV